MNIKLPAGGNSQLSQFSKSAINVNQPRAGKLFHFHWIYILFFLFSFLTAISTKSIIAKMPSYVIQYFINRMYWHITHTVVTYNTTHTNYRLQKTDQVHSSMFMAAVSEEHPRSRCDSSWPENSSWSELSLCFGDTLIYLQICWPGGHSLSSRMFHQQNQIIPLFPDAPNWVPQVGCADITAGCNYCRWLTTGLEKKG